MLSKPIELVRWLVKSFSNEGELILDPFLGSGTTVLACLQTNRNYLGIEKSSEYIELTKKRLQKYENVPDFAGID
jgi:site-specific DNA-methyltransferase (adenine-specific)